LLTALKKYISWVFQSARFYGCRTGSFCNPQNLS